MDNKVLINKTKKQLYIVEDNDDGEDIYINGTTYQYIEMIDCLLYLIKIGKWSIDDEITYYDDETIVETTWKDYQHIEL